MSNLTDLDPLFSAPVVGKPPTARPKAPSAPASAPASGLGAVDETLTAPIVRLDQPPPSPEKKTNVDMMVDFLNDLDPKYYGAVLGSLLGPKIQAKGAEIVGRFPSATERRATEVNAMLERLRQEQQYAQLVEGRGGPATPRPGMTSGEKWSANWADVERPGVGGVPEAAAAYQRTKGHGPVTSKQTKMWGPPKPGEPAQLTERLLARTAEAEQALTAQQAAAMRVEQELQRATAGGPLTRLAQAVFRPAVGVLGGAGAGMSAIETYQKQQAGDIPGAALAGTAGALSLGSLFAPVLAPPALAAGVLNFARDVYREKLKPSEEEIIPGNEYIMAQRLAFPGAPVPKRYGQR